MIHASDHYEVLKIDRNASKHEIKRAFYRLAKQFHPDVNPGSQWAEDCFKQINQSYSVLSDPELRRRYDLEQLNQKFWRRAEIISSLIFRRKTGPHSYAPQRGKDLLRVVHISLKEALTGVKYTLDYEKQVTCFTCEGYGEIAPKACPYCNGAGLVPQNFSLKVVIPPGMHSGEKIALKGEGAHGRFGGRNGDLCIQVIVPNGAAISRNGDDLLINRDVKISELLLGGTIDLQEFGTGLQAKITPLSNPESVLRIRGKGFINTETGKRGDILVRLCLKVPKKLTHSELLTLKAIADINHEF